jgi:hypothetical protein
MMMLKKAIDATLFQAQMLRCRKQHRTPLPMHRH